MIEVYKILTLMYDGEVVPTLHKRTYTKTRGNSLKLKTERSRYDSRKYSFTPRVVNVWNSLPDSVVCAISVNAFKVKRRLTLRASLDMIDSSLNRFPFDPELL